ncbi:hypothetical protein UT300012_32140 [Paraclostridium bifermentans]
MSVIIKEIDKKFNLTLNKVSGELLSEIDERYLKDISKTIVDIDKIELSIPKYILGENFKKCINPLYNLLKHERVINLNNKESYIIKNISKDNDKYKNITAESREVNLKKIDLKFEDIGFRLTSDDEENNIYCLDDHMYNETGWRFGHIDDRVKFQSDGVTEKMRWQEAVEGYWYEYLTKTMAEQFECIVIFDSYNKLVNLYDIDGFGGEIKLYLTNDNYIKSLEKQTSSSDIVTRLRLEGNEGLSIVEGNPSGVDYLENYSYFIDNEEMSENLIQALSTYDEVVAKRTIEWKELLDIKSEKNTKLDDEKMKMLQVTANIKATENMKKSELAQENPSEELLAKYNASLTKYRDEEKLIDIAIEKIEDELERVQSSIDKIVILCAKKTATDDNGELIFNDELLDELKNYIYVDTFSDDAYLNIEDLINVGRRRLEINCRPTSTWSIDVTDFTSRIVDNGFRQHFDGVLGLGDIIILWDEENDKEELVFFTGFTKNPRENKLDITLSNKKVDRDDLIGISNILTDAKKTSRLLKSKRYLLIQQEKNRMNIPYKKGGS